MSDTTPARILVIDDNTAIHEDFRKVLEPESGAAESYDQAAASLFRRPTNQKEVLLLSVEFAMQGQEGLACVQRALRDGKPYAMAFVDMRMPPGWDGLETIAQIWKVQPELLMVICTAFSDYSWAELNQRLGQSDRFLILKKPFDNVEVQQLAHALTARSLVERKLYATQQELLEAARLAGMAEVATGVLHNVGNVLNSVNVSASLLRDNLNKSQIQNLVKATNLLRDHADDTIAFLSKDPRGQLLPGFLIKLSEHLASEQRIWQNELEGLCTNIEHIKKIVSMQQRHVKVFGALEPVPPAELVQDALRMNAAAFERSRIQVVREFNEATPTVFVDRHKVLQIIINLLHNARDAMEEQNVQEKRLVLTVRLASPDRVRITVSDNGVGIPPESLVKIFNHGFTTKKDGHGFGLHSSANAAIAMGGSLTAHSAGVGQGAEFALELSVNGAALGSDT